MQLQNYLQMIGKTEEEFRKGYEDEAKVSIKNRLVLEAIIKEENIQVDDATIEEKLKSMAEMYGRKIEDLKQNKELINYVEASIKNEKAVDFIVENAKIK